MRAKVHLTGSVSAGLAVLCLACGCGVEHLDVSYLEIAAVSAAPGGTVEPDGIVAVRVVVDAQSLGFYPVPATVPVLGTGRRSVRIEPVVRRSGLSEDLRVYPLYEPISRDLDLRPEGITTITPAFGYTSTARIGFDEGFESASSALVLDLVAAGSAPLTQDTQDVRAGGGSGLITLSAERPVYEVSSVLIVPDRERVLELWVELDFRGDVPLAVALLPETLAELPPGTPRIARYFQGALPRTSWTKLYFDIVDASNEAFVGAGFRVSLLAQYDPTRGGEQRVHLDNLRVVYR